MILTDRDVFVGFHLTPVAKEQLRVEANRRNKSMSALLSELVEGWLETASGEKLEKVRSNKRIVNPNEEDVPLPFTEPVDG